MSASTLRPLLAGALDYAGLFPPAGLDLAAAVAEAARARRGPESWLLGRFVVPASRLAELARLVAGPGERLALSVVVGEPAADAPRLDELAGHPRLAVEAVELLARRVDDVGAAAELLRDGRPELEIFAELPAAHLDDPEAHLAACRRHGVAAKVRTGGTEPSAFFPPAILAAFVAAAAQAQVPFKATAGLHHALSGDYPVTYAPDAPRAPMQGFLPLFAGTALLAAGRLDATGLARLLASGASAFRRVEDVLQVDEHPIDRAVVQAGRRLLRSFGSCSFQEPVDDLERLGLLD